MAEGADISKIISLIMSNPDLIDSIKGMMKTEEKKEDEAVIATPDEIITESEERGAEDATATIAPTSDAVARKKRRNALLCSLKPFVSDSRKQALDTMMSLVDVMEVINRG